MINVNKCIVSMALLCAFAFGDISAQETEPSPWSRFGMGLTIPTLSSPQLMMGGVSSPIIDGYVINPCLLYTSPSPRDRSLSRMPSSA